MMTGLGIILGASLVMFVGSLIYAVIADAANSHKIFQQMLADSTLQARHPVQRNFHRAARRPARVLGSFIF